MMYSRIISCSFIVGILFANLPFISANDGKEAQMGAPATPNVNDESKTGTVAKIEAPHAEKANGHNVDEHKPGEHVTGEVCKIDKTYITVSMRQGVAMCERCGHKYPSPRECVQEGEGNTSYSCPKGSKDSTITVKDDKGEHEAVPITVPLVHLLVQKGTKVSVHKSIRDIGSLVKQAIEGYNPGKWTEEQFKEHGPYYAAMALELPHQPGTPHNCHCC